MVVWRTCKGVIAGPCRTWVRIRTLLGSSGAVRPETCVPLIMIVILNIHILLNFRCFIGASHGISIIALMACRSVQRWHRTVLRSRNCMV